MHTKASGIGSHHQSTTDKTKINYYQNLSPHKSATSGGCTSTKHMIHGTRTVNSHLPLLLMVGRCLSRPDMRVGHWDGRQARGFPDLTRPKSLSKSATSGGRTSTKHMIHGTRTVCFHLPLLLTPAPPLVGFRSMGCSHHEIIRKGK